MFTLWLNNLLLSVGLKAVSLLLERMRTEDDRKHDWTMVSFDREFRLS